jgi:putative lipoprotein
MERIVLAASFMLALLSPALAQAVKWDGATWLVEDIGRRGVIDNAQTTLRIDADGKVSGSTGCNRYFGKATLDGATLHFGPLATTYRACPPALMDQESKFLAALREARMAHLDAMGRLQITKARGETLLTLTRM